MIAGAEIDPSLRGTISDPRDFAREITNDDQDDSKLITTREFRVLIGNRKCMIENHVEIPVEVEEKMLGQERLGHTVILAAVDG